MIKFFRHIRRSLINDNKIGKYFKYAIGEILLVVIGILIALQINNWNDNRIEKQSELNALADLKNEYLLNLTVFDSILRSKKKVYNELGDLIELIAKARAVDSIKPKRRGSSGAVTFDPSQGVINSLLRTGKIDLIKNDSLKYMLTNWGDLLIDYKEDEHWHINFLHSQLYPYETKNLPGHFYKYHPKDGLVSPYKTDAEVISNFKRAINDSEYRNLLLRNHQFLDGTIIEGDRLIAAMQTIISLLKKEIDAKE